MSWKIDHFHGFSFPLINPEFSGQVSPYVIFPKYTDDDQYPTLKSNQVHIYNINYKKQAKLDYVFDFGDGHRFEIDFISLRESEKHESLKDFPRLIDQRGVAPEQYPIFYEENEETNCKK